MSSTPLYSYWSDDPLHQRIRYNYATYQGAAFLNSWSDARNLCRQRLANGNGRPELFPNNTPTNKLLHRIQAGLQGKGDLDTSLRRDLNKLVQRFEVFKRIHDSYTNEWRAEDKDRFHTFENYIFFAEVLVTAYRCLKDLTYLNACLKLMDTLCSIDSGLPAELAGRLNKALLSEQEHIAVLRSKTSSYKGHFSRYRQDDGAWPEFVPTSAEAVRTLNGAVMISCDTARSKAYIQSLIHYGIRPERVIFMGDEKKPEYSSSDTNKRMWNGILLPDLDEPVTQTCARVGIEVIQLKDLDVNSAEMMALLKELQPESVIYSGRGGQIVSQDILDCAPNFLHMHSGWLPSYRGSTTLFYALLEGDEPSVTTLLLDKNIDTGPILTKIQYPAPDVGMDVDLVYDSAIRADCLCRTVTRLEEIKKSNSIEKQDHDEGRTYYVIHPVLKHIALLSLMSPET